MHQFQDSFDNFDLLLYGEYYGNWSAYAAGPNGDTIVYNNTDTDITNYRLYSMYYAYANNATSGTRSFTFNISVDLLQGPEIEAPSTVGSVEKIYTGDPLQFDFKYAGTPQVEEAYSFDRGIKDTVTYDKAYECVEASVTGIDFDGNPITIDDSTVELNGTENGKGTFKPTQAGNYKVKLKVKDSFVASGVKFQGGITEKELDFTVKRKTVDAPSITDSTKTYKAAEYEFAPDAKFDADIMTVNESASSSDVTGVNITWDDTSKIIKATDAATYTVKFKLTDKNYVWKVGTTEVATDQSATIKITPKVLDVPQAVTTDYNGGDQSLKTLTTKPGWYDQSVYTDPTILTVAPATVKAANESGHTVTVTLVSKNYAWANKSSNSSAARTFAFKVNKKELDVEFEDKDGLQVAKFADESQIFITDKDGTGAPTFTLKTKYYEEGNSPNSAVDAPTGLGDWVAMAVLEGTGAENYKVDAEQSFNAAKKKVAYPVLNSDKTLGYNGSMQEFTFTGFDSATMNTPVKPNGADSFDGTTLKATNAGKYTPVFTLKDPTLYEWSGTAPEAVEITAKSVTIIADINNKTTWEKGEAVSLTFTAYALSGESLQLAATSQRDGFAATDIAVTNNGDGTHTVTIPANTVRGSYTLTVKVAESSSNYVAASEITHAFTITAAGAALEENELVWVIGGKNYTVDDLNDDGVLEIEYTGQSISPTVHNAPLVAAGVKVDDNGYGGDTSATDVDDYEITVHIVADGDDVAFDKTFTLKYKIVPKKLDLSNAVWQWQYEDGGEEWKTLSDNAMPSFDNKAVSVRISPDYMASLGLTTDDYSVTYSHNGNLTEKGDKTSTAKVTIANSNYVAEDGGDYIEVPKNWKITAKSLAYTWDEKGQTIAGPDGRSFEIYAIVFTDGNTYTDYYEYYFTVDGVEGEMTRDELEAYVAENWSETAPVSGKVYVRMKADASDEFVINSGYRSFTTGTPKTALTVAVTGSGAEYGLVDFKFSVVRGTSDERARTTVVISGGALTEAKSYDGNAPELVAFVNGLGVGKYVITVSLKAASESSYVLTKSVFDFEVLIRKVIVPQVTKDITYNGAYINIADYLDSNYDANIMSMLSGYTNKTAGAYTVIFKLPDSNYMWVEPTSAEPMSKLFAKVLFVNEISIDNSELTATLGWTINKIVLSTDSWNLSGKEGVSLNALADYQSMITANGLEVAIGYRYYDTNGNLIEEPVLKGGDKYIVEAYLAGEDAVNFEFADGTGDKSVSAQQEYTVPQSAAAKFFGNAVGFAKANLLWLIIAAAVLLFLIILICIIASAKKKKRKREELAEQRRLEEKEERKREQEERRLEREERMARMSQMQAAPQPQYIPQPMPQPQPQYTPQTQAQPAASGGGTVSEAQFLQMQAELKAEISALKAEQSAKEIAALRAEVAMRDDISVLRSEGRGQMQSGMNVEAMTEIMTMALKNVLTSATQQVIAGQPAQPAQLTDGSANASAATQVPPDAVMTTVTTTKIDTTKKAAQPAQTNDRTAPAGRTIVRNFVAPMPVDDGRVFDVGGFYTPADPVADIGLTEDTDKNE